MRKFTLSFGQARLGPNTTARLAAVILFISHLNIKSEYLNPTGCSQSKPVSDETQKLHQIFEDNIVLVRQLLDDKILTIVETALSWNV